MARDAAHEAIAQVLGESAAAALHEWAVSQSRSVRLTSPPWTASGYTGAVLASINVSRDGEPDTKLIVKICPPGPYAREPAAHQRAVIHSTPHFNDRHLVKQTFSPFPTGDGGYLMFQEIAGATISRQLADLPDDQLVAACQIVVESVIAEWNPPLIRLAAMNVRDFLHHEWRAAVDVGGSMHALAMELRLWQPEARWLLDDRGHGNPVPNPFLMLTDDSLGASLRLDVVVGPSHGDLHSQNVLIPEEYGHFEPRGFRLVDLSTFDAGGPVSRDPVTLMMSVIAPQINDLRSDEQEALLDFVLSPWRPTPSRLSGLLVATLEAIHRAGYEAIKSMRLGDWRSQYLLSILAAALSFTSYENVGDRGRWWFFRLAGNAGSAFLKLHEKYHPVDPLGIHRPLKWPAAPSRRAGSAAASTGHGRDDRPAPRLDDAAVDELVRLVVGTSKDLLMSVYRDAVDPVEPQTQPNWADGGAVARWIVAMSGDSEADLPVPPMLIYVDRLAHAVEKIHDPVAPRKSLALHQWITAAAGKIGVGVDHLRRLCVETKHSMAFRPGAADVIYSSPTESVDVMTSLSSDEPGGVVSISPMPTKVEPYADTRERPARTVIRSNIPARNPDFTGREELLARLSEMLRTGYTASVVPRALHGLGGVGKTQIAIEYVYRNIDEYQLIWWVAAEDAAQARLSMAQLAERLELPAGQDMKQSLNLVRDALSTSSYRFLIVYDNVDLPEDLVDLMPSTGSGHILITSRNNAGWVGQGNSIEVDVLPRAESIELLQRHGGRITNEEADQLAEKLGDLPLALEQAAIWHGQTGMPVVEYLDEFDRNIGELLREGKPTNYPETIYGLLAVALSRLRQEKPAAAELLELFAFLGSEPISVALLRRGRASDLSPALRDALERPIELNRIIREVRRYGLARVDLQGQRIQVHRLLQHVLRAELRADRLVQSRSNAHALLAAANPGYPDEPSTWPVHAEIGPHIRAAQLIAAEDESARFVVLDQIRYLFRRGDYEGSRSLGEAALESWREASEHGLGPDHELTLIASRHLANALRLLGEIGAARDLDMATFERLRTDPRFGEEHEHTLYTANNIGVDLRLQGDFDGALRTEEDNVRRHERVFGSDDEHTWRALNNLAVSLRHLGDFKRAEEVDEIVVAQWRKRVGPDDSRTLFAQANLARDLCGRGQYANALDIQRKILPRMRELLGERHGDVLLAARTTSVALRKIGHYADARDSARDNYHAHHARFGPSHEYTLSAAATYANGMRCCGEYGPARSLMREIVDQYRHVFGPGHPLALAACVNLTVALRCVGDLEEARALGVQVLESLEAVLGKGHPYTVCATNGVAIDLALAGDVPGAAALSLSTLAVARKVLGHAHPDTLSCAVNAALNLGDSGQEEDSRALLEKTLAVMTERLGADHPETLDAARGQRAECDVEPPPS